MNLKLMQRQNDMKIILSHPTGNANVRAVALAFANESILERFYTSFSCFPDSFLDFVSKYPLFSEIKRRQFDSILKPYTTIYPWREAGRLIAPKMGLKKLTRHESGFLSIDRVYADLDCFVARNLKNSKGCGVYAYEDGALYSFKEAMRLGLPRLYDLPIGYWRTARTILEQERELWPDWAETLIGLSDSEVKLARKDEELKLATNIFVASNFTAKTLQSYPGQLAPVHIIPYGFPPVIQDRTYLSISKSRRLKLLFVGGLSQRKGIANLFEVVEKLKNYVELTIVGRKGSNNCQVLNEALSKHHWIDSLPHSDILELMRKNDVLVFPSLFEGFGLVITEAMSQGTPVITTERTAGPDIIEHENNGWLIEAGSTQALQAAIEKILLRPDTIAETGKAAMETANRRPWNLYGLELARAVKYSLLIK